jgi:uncharacterized membrane protein HdeD (DUF308 family)
MSARGGQSAPEPVPSGIGERPSAGLVSYVHELGTGVIVVGAISVICGVIAVAWPKISLLALAIVAGFDLICLGAVSIARAFQGDRDTGVRALSGVLGLFGVVAGIAVVKRPGDTLVVIVLAVGLWLFGSGVVEMLNAAFTPGRRALGLLIGAIDVIFAVVILSWPKISLGTLAVLTGIVFIIRGALMVYNGLQVRRAASAA